MGVEFQIDFDLELLKMLGWNGFLHLVEGCTVSVSNLKYLSLIAIESFRNIQHEVFDSMVRQNKTSESSIPLLYQKRYIPKGRLISPGIILVVNPGKEEEIPRAALIGKTTRQDEVFISSMVKWI